FQYSRLIQAHFHFFPQLHTHFFPISPHFTHHQTLFHLFLLPQNTTSLHQLPTHFLPPPFPSTREGDPNPLFPTHYTINPILYLFMTIHDLFPITT
ncbi:hypothetical protein, partial [Neisseria sicca]|uniref:hypothetical protein n=1 Tax=Neisseria sicca TaxID=490 RepID=UPI001C9A2268